MTGTFNHGSRVHQSSYERAVAVRIDNSVIGILGTAPDSDIPLDTPFWGTGGALLAAVGTTGTLHDNIETMMDEGAKRFVVVRVAEGADTPTQRALVIGDRAAKTGLHAFSKSGSLGVPFAGIRLSPGMPADDALDGIQSVAVTAPGSGYGENTTVTVSGDGGSGTGAVLKPILTNDGKLDGVAIVTPGYGYTAPLTVTVTDPDGGADATCTGTIGKVLDPIVAEAAAIAEADGSHYYHDLPDGTDQDAITSRNLCGSRHVSMVAPRGLKSVNGITVPLPSSPVFAAQQAVMDAKEGPHWPGSNILIKSFIGTNRPIEYGEQSNLLNENGINTIINRKGLRTWGVWTCSFDPKWQFVSVVRTTNIINRTIEDAVMEYNAKPANGSILDYVLLTGRAVVNDGEDDGWLLPGSSFELAPVDGEDFEGETNSPDKAVVGKFRFACALEVPAPLVDILITGKRNHTVAYTLLFDSVTGRVSIEA